MRQRHKGKKSKDTCSCWVCRDRKYREDRQREKKRIEYELEQAFGGHSLILNTKDIEPEIQDIINRGFWDLI